jgi:membrane dipeptidase
MVRVIGTLVLFLVGSPGTSSAEEGKFPVAILHADTFTDVCGGGVSIHSEKLQLSSEKMQKGGVALVGAAIWIDNKVAEPKAALEHVEKTANCIREVANFNPHLFVVARSAAEAETAMRGHKASLVITVEGGEPAEAGPDALKKMYEWGVRAISLTWSRDNGLASAHNTKNDNGLSEKGKNVVAEMNRLGMMVDVSHGSDKTAEDVLKTSKAPVYASHSNCRSVTNVTRNLTDAQIRAIASGGGVVGINFHLPHLEDGESGGLAAHADCLKKLGGPGAVAIGADYDGRIKAPPGLDDAEVLGLRLQREFKSADFKASEIQGAMYGNFIKFWKKVEATASSPKTREIRK